MVSSLSYRFEALTEADGFRNYPVAPRTETLDPVNKELASFARSYKKTTSPDTPFKDYTPEIKECGVMCKDDEECAAVNIYVSSWYQQPEDPMTTLGWYGRVHCEFYSFTETAWDSFLENNPKISTCGPYLCGTAVKLRSSTSTTNGVTASPNTTTAKAEISRNSGSSGVSVSLVSIAGFFSLLV